MILHMIIEQTIKYQYRMKYNPLTNSFEKTKNISLFYARNCIYPYGWIKESGTPPNYHFDCILISNRQFELGEIVQIKIIGIFKRNDLDHKFIVTDNFSIKDIKDLQSEEKENLKRLYPNVAEGEGFFGVETAMSIYSNGPKSY